MELHLSVKDYNGVVYVIADYRRYVRHLQKRDWVGLVTVVGVSSYIATESIAA
jgi:hypothetical protein